MGRMTPEQIETERKAFLEWLQRAYPSEGNGPRNIVNGLEEAWLASAERNRMPDTAEHTFQHYRADGGIACKLCEQIEAKLQRIREIKSKGVIRYSRNLGEPDPTPAFPAHVEFSMQDWDELEKELKHV